MALKKHRANINFTAPFMGSLSFLKATSAPAIACKPIVPHILSSGSYALWNAKLRADSSLVEKLRANGLIILGKTSLSEWSMLRSTNSTKSWNAISGQGYATYFPKQCPGGSSGGNATAVDLGLAWAAVGTETSGSIVSPCERNNIVGIKPTVGLTSRYMVVPVSEHQDTVGPMTRTVEDAARLLEIIAGPDPMDAYTLSSPLSRIPKYSASCRLDRLRGKRIGIARNVLDTEADLIKHMLPAFEEATALMSSAGATIIDNADFTAYAAWKARPCNLVTRADFASNISQFFANLEHNPRQIRDLAGLREFTHSCAAEEYPKRNTHSWDIALEQELHNQSLDFAKHYQENLLFGGEGGVLGALERHQLDAIVLPTTIAYEIPALVGSPIITVPLGAAGAETNIKRFAGWDIVDLAPGVPFGISFLGRKWSEEVLIEIAYAFEQMHQVQGKLERAMKTPEPDLVNVVHSGEVPLDE
ncbi:amidase [Stemphylium lycopersici]|uniref:Amidase n=1 Tax=Stemphylium lycopersici TaxID=183478 RepID=A0A364N5J5_STELY|nr:amidase [Stemphylium lycopersici]